MLTFLRSVTRRTVLAFLPTTVAVVGLAGGAAALLVPRVPRRPGRLRRVCRLAEMDVGGQVRLELDRVLVMRDQGGLRAVGLTCTHLGCAVVRHESGFACHCHGSFFDDEGQSLRGPAVLPLPWYAVSVREGWVWVDLDRPVVAGRSTAV